MAAVDKEGASGFQTVGSGLSLTAGSFVQASASNTVESLMAANEEDYPLFDARLQISSGTPTENVEVEIYVRGKADGTNEQPAPSGAYKQTYVGRFVLDNTTGYYYAYDLRNIDKRGTFYLRSNEASTTLTATLSIRMKTGDNV